MDSLREALCVNLNEYVKDMLFFQRNTEKENDRQGKVRQDIREDRERLKGQEERENRKYLHFILNLFYDYTVLRSSF